MKMIKTIAAMIVMAVIIAVAAILLSQRMDTAGNANAATPALNPQTALATDTTVKATPPPISPQQSIASSAADTRVPTPVIWMPDMPAKATPVPTAYRMTPEPDQVSFISSTVMVATKGSGPGQVAITNGWGSCGIGGPSSYDVDSKGNIYIADVLNYRVNKYDASGKFVLSFDYPHYDLNDRVARVSPRREP